MENKLIENLKKSYAPYSKFRVSAILVTKDGKEYTGVNIENASYGATICAERVAITKAISEGQSTSNFKEIHIMCDSKEFAMPCFICRQTFIEFFNQDTLIYVYNNQKEKKIYQMDQICPYPFSKEDLKWKVDS